MQMELKGLHDKETLRTHHANFALLKTRGTVTYSKLVVCSSSETAKPKCTFKTPANEIVPEVVNWN